ncbi:Copia protein [Gossypium australe]|uniref:Copia protein n=1 Tax=Gossypium australe TaxID=47621 RepID=A0A5B6VL02_9ROSI|nr:Copia protein [Gossypium australe]
MIMFLLLPTSNNYPLTFEHAAKYHNNKKNFEISTSNCHTWTVIFLANQLTLTTFSDSNWGSSPEDRRLTSGYCVYLGNNLIDWSLKKKNVVARSTLEVEYQTLANATTDLS